MEKLNGLFCKANFANFSTLFSISMNLLIKLLLIYLLAIPIVACESNLPGIIQPNHQYLTYQGRIDHRPDGSIALISSAASVTIHLSGKSCTVYLRNESPAGQHNFVVFELNGEYLGRYRVDGDSVKGFPIELPAGKTDHLLTIYKASEAANGNVIFTGISGHVLKPVNYLRNKTIEFIGNSITCGSGVDNEIPCGTGFWYDQHNAYWSYGSILSRQLKVRCLLSSVSGIGIYRTWNTDGPAMPDVYPNTYLNTDTTKKWAFPSPAPDVVSICLGTNDFSEGDGIHERKPLDEGQFIRQYISFIQTIYRHYPKTRIALLSSPVFAGEKKELLESCLLKIQQQFVQLPDPKLISLYFFNRTFSSGCTGHPDKNEQKQMADLLMPFFSGLLK